MSWYSVVSSEAVPLCTSPEGLPGGLPTFFGPELSLPGTCNHPVGRCQAALNLLGCLDVLTAAQEKDVCVREDSERARHQSLARVYTREDFSAVNRFESECNSNETSIIQNLKGRLVRHFFYHWSHCWYSPNNVCLCYHVEAIY